MSGKSEIRFIYSLPSSLFSRITRAVCRLAPLVQRPKGKVAWSISRTIIAYLNVLAISEKVQSVFNDADMLRADVEYTVAYVAKHLKHGDLS